MNEHKIIVKVSGGRVVNVEHVPPGIMVEVQTFDRDTRTGFLDRDRRKHIDSEGRHYETAWWLKH